MADYVVHLVAATGHTDYDPDTITTSELIYTSGRGFTTTAASTPASTAVEARVINPGRFSIGSNSFQFFGAVRQQFGAIELWNGDRALDAWRDYGWWGREVIVYRGVDDATTAYPAGWDVVFRCIASHVEFDHDIVRIMLLDKLALLDKPICDTAFAGDGTGTEGDTELEGVPKPVVLGNSLSPVPVTLTDAAKLIYHVSETASRTPDDFRAYDGGVEITRGANYADIADMEANAPAPGTARFLVGGFVDTALGAPTWIGIATT